MTDYQKIIRTLKDVYGEYFFRCLKIRNKSGDIVAFVPNEHQELIIDIIEDWKKQYPDEKTRPTLFIIILKARQVGFSTCIEGLFFHELHFSKNRVAMIVSYDEKSAQNINDMSDRFYQYLPKSIKPMRRPSRGKGILFENPTNNRDEFERNPGLQCKFLIDTAGNTNAGSSFTINYLHISELSKWPDAKATLTSLMQAVPQYGAIVAIESTANGIEYFHKLWQQAKRKELSYRTIFVGWQQHKEYTLNFVSEKERELFVNSITEKELKLQKLHNLTFEQLHWRREMLRSPKINGDENIFLQEYPATDEEAFLTSGRPVYDRLKIQARIKYLELKYKAAELWKKYDDENTVLSELKEAKFETTIEEVLSFKDCNPPETGYIEYEEKTGKYKFIPDEYGTVIIYEHPKKGYPYVMGGDIAEGLSNGCFSVTQVCDNTTGMQVAKQRMHIHPDLFGLEQIKLARYYNQALIADEVNNHGHVVMKTLRDNKYFLLYRREIFDSISKKKEYKDGFDTKDQSRQRIIDRTRAIVRDEIHLINDLDTLGEMMTFIYNEQNKEIHEDDCFDDCVLSFAIMHEARSQQKATPPKTADTFGKGVEYVHPSVIEDSHKNKKVKEYYRKKYEQNRIKLGGQ